VDKLNSLLKKLWGRMAIFISNMLYLAAIGGGGGGGGATYIVRNKPLIGWQSLYDVGDVTASEFVDGFPASAVWSGDTYTRWKSPASGLTSFERSLTFFKSGSGSVDYVGIAGHNLGDNEISYQLFSSTDGVSWTDETPARVPVDNSAIIEHFDSVVGPYFKLVFVVPAETEGVTVAHVKIGRILQLERPRYVGDIPAGMDTQVEKIASKSYSGQHLGSVLISQGNKFSITQENNTPGFIRAPALQNFFRHAHLLQKLSNGPTETFFFAWRPDDLPLEVQYCGETTSFNAPTNQRANGLMQWSMSGDAYL